MLDYKTAIENVFGACVVDDGYNGGRVAIMLASVDGHLIEIHSEGCHRGPCPPCLDRAMVIWESHNRPACKRRYGTIQAIANGLTK